MNTMPGYTQDHLQTTKTDVVNRSKFAKKKKAIQDDVSDFDIYHQKPKTPSPVKKKIIKKPKKPKANNDEVEVLDADDDFMPHIFDNSQSKLNNNNYQTGLYEGGSSEDEAAEVIDPKAKKVTPTDFEVQSTGGGQMFEAANLDKPKPSPKSRKGKKKRTKVKSGLQLDEDGEVIESPKKPDRDVDEISEISAHTMSAAGESMKYSGFTKKTKKTKKKKLRKNKSASLPEEVEAVVFEGDDKDD